jgi:hypothetical protein
MKRKTNPLDDVRVAAPCPAEWERMTGTEQVRFCAQCQLNVYNLSGMTRTEAERLIAQAEGRLCVRYFRRADGTIITRNCPVGLRTLKRRLSKMTTAVVSLVLSFLAGVLAYSGMRQIPARLEYVLQQLAVKLEESSRSRRSTQTQGMLMHREVKGEVLVTPAQSNVGRQSAGRDR